MAYLTVQQYLDRYGERETTLFTNEDAPTNGQQAQYDSIKVEAAIDDATEEVEGYVSRRYATPLPSVPKIVAGWVAAIARLKLAEGTGRVSDVIKDAADRATRQLEQLAASKIDLPVPENTAPLDPVGAGTPLTSNDRATPMFGNSVMDTFTAPFTDYGCGPVWREGR